MEGDALVLCGYNNIIVMLSKYFGKEFDPYKYIVYVLVTRGRDGGVAVAHLRSS